MKDRFRLRDFSTEFMVGGLFFLALLILSYFTIILSTENWFKTVHRQQVVFSEVAGLAEGDAVLVRGVRVGTVRDIELLEDGVLVHLTLTEDIQFTEGYRIQVRPGSILGGRHVAIDPGPADGQRVPRHTRLQGEDSVDVMTEAAAAVSEIRGEIASIREALREGETVEKLVGFVDDLQTIGADLREGRGLLGRLLRDEEFARDAQLGLAAMREAGDNLAAAADQVEGAIADLRAGRGTLGKLATDETLYNDLQAIFGDLREGRGTIGRLLSEDEVHENIRAITADLRRLTGQVREGDSSLARLFGDGGELFEHVRDAFKSIADLGRTLQEGDGSLARMINDDELYHEARHMMLELRSAIQDFREQSTIATFGSFVFGAF